ncbi:MAG: oligosaccharide flippase family protein [Methanobacterium sp.]
MLNEYKIFVKRIGLIGVANILVALSNFILIPVLTKNFSIENYGVWVQINTTLILASTFITLGLPFTMVRFLSAEKDKEKIQEGFYSITGVILISTLIATIFLLVFSKNIALLLFNGNTELGVILPFIVFLFCLNGFLFNYFRTFQQTKRYSIFLLLQTYLSVLVVSFLVILGFGINLAAIGLIISNLVTFLIMIILIVSEIGFKVPKFLNLREYLSFGLPTVPSNLSYWIVDASDRYIIGILLGAAFVGYYNPGYSLGYIITMLITPFATLLPATLPTYYENNDNQKLRIYLKYSLKYFLLIAIPSFFILSILSKPILMILTTPEIAINGYLVTPFMALSGLLFGIYYIFSEILVLNKKTRLIGVVWLIAAIMNIVLNILLVPYFGILAAAAVTLFTYTIAFILTAYYSFKFFNFDNDYLFILKSISASILTSIVIIISHPEGIINVVFIIIVSFIVYFIIIMLLKGIKTEEINFLKEMLNN